MVTQNCFVFSVVFNMAFLVSVFLCCHVYIAVFVFIFFIVILSHWNTKKLQRILSRSCPYWWIYDLSVFEHFFHCVWISCFGFIANDERLLLEMRIKIHDTYAILAILYFECLLLIVKNRIQYITMYTVYMYVPLSYFVILNTF